MNERTQRIVKGAFAKEHGEWVDGTLAKAGQVWHTKNGVYRCVSDTANNPDSDTTGAWSTWVDKTDINEAVTKANALFDAWVEQNPVAGMMRVTGGSDPSASKIYGASQVKELAKHLRPMLVKNGKVVSYCAPGRITLASNGDTINIDGTAGDIVVGMDCDNYMIKAEEAIEGVQMSMMGVSLAPCSWQGHVSKKFKPWAVSPCEMVNAKIGDDVRAQAHCCYNTAVNGTWSTPTAFFNENVFPNGAGLCQGSVSGFNSILYAQNKNADASTCVPYMGDYYEFEEFIRTMMYTEGGTKDVHTKDLFGPGCITSDPTTNGTFYDSAVSADSGFKIIRSNGTHSYYDIWGTLKLNSSANATQALYGLNGQVYNFVKELEELRLLDAITANGWVGKIGAYSIFYYDDNGALKHTTDDVVNPYNGSGMDAGRFYYQVRGVPGYIGMESGVMTAVINRYLKVTAKSGVCDNAGTDISGCAIIFKHSLPIYCGWTPPLRGYFRHITGMHFTTRMEDGKYKVRGFLAPRPEDMQPLTNTTQYGTIGTKFNILKGLTIETGDVVVGNFWAGKADYNKSLFLYTGSGGNAHTHECAFTWRDCYCWGQNSNGLPDEGYECVLSSVAGCSANNAHASASSLDSNPALSGSYAFYAGAFAVYPLATA